MLTFRLSVKQTARLAGFIYLLVVIFGLISLMYIPGRLIRWDNAEVTLQQLKDHTTLFRFGILSNIICYTAFLLLPLVLYRLFKPVNATLSALMVLLAVVSVPLSFAHLQNKFAILTLLEASTGGNLLQLSLQEQVMFYLKQFENGNLVLQTFWGLWLFPFGYLIVRSGMVPKILGILLMLGCMGYLVNMTGNILFPFYSTWGISGFVRLPASLGEIGTCLWLLIAGAKPYKKL
jgi:hypothetical protein